MTTSRAPIAAVALLLPLGGCAPAEPPTGGPGDLVIIGGALQAENAAVYEAVIAGRSGGGPLCVIPTASADPQDAIAGMVARLDSYAGDGAATGILISTENPESARSQSVADEISACSGYYFTGGSQSRVLDVFLPEGDTTVAYRALRARWEEGAVIGGSSAGAAMMANSMIAGGSSDEAISEGVAPDRDSDGVQIRGGMGFFEPAHLDQHFLARGRIGRLLVAAIDEESPMVGLGIDENTALVVAGDSAVVIGASGVVVVNARDAFRADPYRAEGMQLYLAGRGDVIDLRTFEVRFDPSKTAMPEMATDLVLPDDPFERWAFLKLLVGLSTTAESTASFAIPSASLTITEEAGFAAVMSSPEGGVETAPQGFSAGPFRVDLIEGGGSGGP